MNWPIENFHFLRPEWFLALFPLLVLIVVLRRIQATQSGWQSVIAGHLYQHMIAGKTGKTKRAPLWLLFWGWTLAVFALAGPTWERLPQPVFQVQEGHVVLLDMSLSMRATDVSPDRLTRAKYKAIDLIDAIDEGEMGLVAYAGDAFAISPLTTDATNLVALIPSLSPEIMPVQGSDPYRGLEEAASLLENAGYQKGTIYWITDGVDLQQSQDISNLISDMSFKVNVLAVGTEGGAPIRQINGELLKDNRGQIVIPKLRGQQLQSLASKSGGTFTMLTADGKDVSRLVSDQGLHNAAEASDDNTAPDGDQWDELGPWILLVLLPFAAYAFRRGILASLILVPLVLSHPSPAVAQQNVASGAPASAPAEQPAQVDIPWYEKPFMNADQQGFEAFNGEAYSQAENSFNDPAWRGSSAYEAGNYQAALDAFSQLDTVDALYNQGNALAQLGELDEAIKRYDAVLEKDPDHADAKANKALLEQMKEQQEQQQQDQQQKNQQQDQQQDQQNGQNGEQSDDQQNQQQDQQNQQDQNDQSQQQQNPSDQQSDNQNPADNRDEQSEQDQQNDNQQEKDKPEESSQDEQQGESEQPQSGEQDEQQAEQQAAQAQAGELTDEEKEKMQRLENLMKKIPDDPAFLLKRKMQLEAQKRRRQAPPTTRSEW